MSNERYRVLLVDDDPAMLRRLTPIITDAGFDVEVAQDGREALAKILADCPHILVTDWEMPQLDGLELCRAVRAGDLPHYLYIVFVTGRTKDEDNVQALLAGADDFVCKPVLKQNLIARLEAGRRVLDLQTHLTLQAQTDTLTGIGNRRTLYAHFDRELARATRYGTRLSCVIIDVDFFKVINDKYGHETGDDVLRELAHLLQERSRTSDVICRHGGEEFCVLLPQTDEHVAALWAERLREAITELTTPSEDGSIRITVSVGVAERNETDTTAAEIIAHADRALRVAKTSGRNRVVSYSRLNEDFTTERKTPGRGPDVLRNVLVRDLMTSPIVSLHENDTVGQAAELFLQVRINSAPVVDDQGKLTGIFSEKDILQGALAEAWWTRPVHDAMTRNVICYEENTPAPVVYDFLCRTTIRRIVIVKEGQPTGVISRGSLMRWLGNWGDIRIERSLLRSQLPSDETRRRSGDRLLATADALDLYSQSIAKLSKSEMSGNATFELVDIATKIQEISNDLLAFSHVNYRFEPHQIDEDSEHPLANI